MAENPMIDGVIRISRTTSNTREDYISISIQAAENLSRRVTVEMALEDFARCITGANEACRFRLPE